VTNMMEGGRLVAVLVLLFLMSETGVHLFCQLTGWVTPPPPRQQDTEAAPGDKKQVLSTITGHCLPKLVCQLYALENTQSISDSERNLISLIGSATLSGFPSKYSFAAHMGQLVRGVDGQGCHNFYPGCPFSNQDVMHIAKRINFK